MNEVIDAIVNRKDSAVTRADIAKVLESVGPPGVYQDKKVTAVEHLFSLVGGGMNAQGHKVSDDLESYEEY